MGITPVRGLTNLIINYLLNGMILQAMIFNQGFNALIDIMQVVFFFQSGEGESTRPMDGEELSQVEMVLLCLIWKSKFRDTRQRMVAFWLEKGYFQVFF